MRHQTEIALHQNIARLPIAPAVAEACDAGRVESLDTRELEPALQAILAR